MGMTWDDVDESTETRVAGDALVRLMVERELARAAEARVRLRDDDPEWRAAAFTDQSMAWLTAEELAEVERVIREFFLAKLDRLEQPDKRPPGSRLCSLLAWAYPTYDVADPTPAATGDHQEGRPS
jgi:hypothetical protein